MMNKELRVSAKWSGIEKKVLWSVTFTNLETNKLVILSGYISKGGLFEDMKTAGATPAQIKEAKELGKHINTSALRR